MTRIIGAHLSAAGGVHKAVERAAAIGCNAVQVFSGSPRVWQRPPVEAVDTAALASSRKQFGVGPIFTHALYLVNLASDNPTLLASSIGSLQKELFFDAKVSGSGVIVHLGSHQGRGFEAMRVQIVESIVKILDATPQGSTFLIENAAGQKGKIGGKLEEIAWLLTELEMRAGYVTAGRLGWCFDTCHGHAAGLDLSNAADAIDSVGLVASLRCIHVNDSRDPFGSGRDRHENLGDGLIPPEEMRAFLDHQSIRDIPLVLEVPGLNKEGPDAENVNRLRKLISQV